MVFVVGGEEGVDGVQEREEVGLEWGGEGAGLPGLVGRGEGVGEREEGAAVGPDRGVGEGEGGRGGGMGGDGERVKVAFGEGGHFGGVCLSFLLEVVVETGCGWNLRECLGPNLMVASPSRHVCWLEPLSLVTYGVEDGSGNVAAAVGVAVFVREVVQMPSSRVLAKFLAVMMLKNWDEVRRSRAFVQFGAGNWRSPSRGRLPLECQARGHNSSLCKLAFAQRVIQCQFLSRGRLLCRPAASQPVRKITSVTGDVRIATETNREVSMRSSEMNRVWNRVCCSKWPELEQQQANLVGFPNQEILLLQPVGS